MTTTIKLDTNAMNALFPEGTEARVKLQQSVIQNVANSFIKTGESQFITAIESKVDHSLRGLSESVNKLAHRLITEKIGKVTGFGMEPKLTEEMRDLLEVDIERNLKQIIREISHENVRATVLENIHAERLESLADKYLRKYCKESAQKIVDKLLCDLNE